MHQPIHGSTCHERVGEDLGPFIEIPVAGNDHRVAFIAHRDELVEVCLLGVVEISESEVIKDEQRDGSDLCHASLMAVISLSCVKPLKQRIGVAIQGIMAPETGFMAECLCKVAFSHPRGAHQEDVLLFAYERASCKLFEGGLMDFWVETEVEGGKGLVGVKAAAGDAPQQLFVVPTFHFITEQGEEEVSVLPFLTQCLLYPAFQGFEYA